MVSVLTDNSYGKSSVRLMKVTRLPDRHDLKEVCVNIQFEGEFEKVYTKGDNSNVLPTDTMKNTVYAIAKDHPLRSIEEFGLTLSNHFLLNNPDVLKVTIELIENLWNRISVSAAAPELHPWSFSGGGNEKRNSIVTRTRTAVSIRSGIQDLLILKTSGSAFKGYMKDKYTTLKETDDRIFATNAEIRWTYTREDLDFNVYYQKIRQALLETFAKQDSRSVQHTLYAMGESALAACVDVSEISLTMPNKHCILVDFSPFGVQNKNEIFVPTSEPHGLISGTVKRK
jgi:urate oxidase